VRGDREQDRERDGAETNEQTTRADGEFSFEHGVRIVLAPPSDSIPIQGSGKFRTTLRWRPAISNDDPPAEAAPKISFF
jgi:hypothetical protein